ncbi:MAG: ABC transporter permease [Chloroflexia bacterium]|nr:ABC transporter permease [Chloroflexia bacterium]
MTERVLPRQPVHVRATEIPRVRQSTPWRLARRPRWTPMGLLGLALVTFIVVIALLGPWLIPTDPQTQDLAGRLAPPVWLGGTWTAPLGTDGLGRDLLARIANGARISLLVGVVATTIAAGVGVTLGLIGGFGGGWLDRLTTFVTEVQLAVPFVVVAIAVTATLGHGVWKLILVLALTGWVGYARIVRLQAAALRRAPFIEAARAIGATPVRIAMRHTLPQLPGPIIVVASQQVAAMILYEAALSYLGLGVPSDVITWGGMVAAGRDSLLTAWWVSTLPGVAIALTILGLHLLGDWFIELADPVS